jgi:class 3 adenylate cyclase
MIGEQIKTLPKSLINWVDLRLRPGLRLKITLPYILLAVLLAIGGALVISQLVVDSVQERFVNQLMETGRLAANRVVEVEQESLATLRIVAHTDGVARALLDGDTEAARELVYPVAINDRTDVIEFLDRDGAAFLSLYHQRGGPVTDYAAVQGADLYITWPFVNRVLRGEEDEAGDKFAGLVPDAPWGATFYVAGPIFYEDELAGVILVGSYLDQVVADLRSSSGAHHVTIYTSDGQPLVTTIPAESGVVATITPDWYAAVLDQQGRALVNTVGTSDQPYSQAFMPFEARHGNDLAVLSTALSQGYLVRTSPVSRLSLTLITVATLLGVIAIGTAVARQIARPVLAIARASRHVAQGDLSQEVQINTRDEVGELAQAFNEMVVQLRLAEAVKDIFGRAVSPEVSAALIDAVSSGQITLGGETRQVTILFSDIKGFTSLSEQRTASQVMGMLNEFFAAIYPAIDEYGGVINKFGGDSTMALFGAPIPQGNHARRAVFTGLAMCRAVAELNARRADRGQVPIHIGVGINTGEVVVGTLGAAERLEYTAIGDPVNVASRIEGLTRRLEAHDVLISQATLDAMGSDHGFFIEDLGGFAVKGKTSLVHIYSVRGKATDA